MSLHDRIKEARKNKGLTQEQLGELIGVAKTTITGYEKNREPTAQKVGEIADALGVDVNFLFQDEVRELQFDRATSDEMELIKKYRSLDSYGKDMVDTVLNKEVYRVKAQAVTYPVGSAAADMVRELPLYYMPASAGKGNYLDNSDFEMISVIDAAFASSADFAVKVSGDSMEPRFSTGDIILVKEQSAVEVGELGVFILNGDSLFKKFGGDRLISLNDTYADIEITENDSCYCKGKVLGAIRSLE